jgi:hypothetical protein
MFPVRYEHNLFIESKANSVTDRGSQQGCEMMWIPHCLDSQLRDGCKAVSLTHWPRCNPQNDFYFCLWYSILLEVE